MPVRHMKSASDVHIGSIRTRHNMETIWLQRSSSDMPWGFRMVGGRDFGLPLTIQRVTPGSVAAAALGPGDVILKVGNVMATNLEHNDVQEIIKQAGNILQLTIRKPDGTLQPSPISSSGIEYGTQLTVETGDYNAISRGFGTGIPLNNSASPNYATTPRNFGSRHQSLQAADVNMQNVSPGQQTSEYTNNHYDESAENDTINFPDYTKAYKIKEIVHDSPGGPDNIRGFVPPSENNNYSTQSLPRGVGGYKSSNVGGGGGVGGPPVYDTKSPNVNHNYVEPSVSVDVKFGTGLPFQSSNHKPQDSYISTVSQSSKPAGYIAQPAANYNAQSSLTYTPQPPASFTLNSTGGYTEQPVASYTPQSTGSYIEQPGANYTKQSTGSYIEQPGANYTKQSNGSYTPQPPATFTPNSTVSYTEQPVANYTKQSNGSYTPQPPATFTPNSTGIYTPQPPATFTPNSTGSYTEQPVTSYTTQPAISNTAPPAASFNAQRVYNSLPRPFSPPTFTGPVSPRIDTNTSGIASIELVTPAGNLGGQPTPYQSGSNGFDQSNIHVSGSNTYATLPHSKPSYNTNNNVNNFNMYKSTPQPYSAPKPYAPAQTTTGSTLNQSTLPFTPSQPGSIQSQASPGASSGFSVPQSVIRKVSFDQNAEDHGMFVKPTNFTARPFKPHQPTTSTGYSSSVHSRSNSQLDENVSAPAAAGFPLQSSKREDVYIAVPYNPPGGPISPRQEAIINPDVNRYDPSGANRNDPSGINEGVNILNLSSPRYEPIPLVSPAPSSPPPPPPPGPPPPPAPILNQWNPVPYRRPNYQQRDEPEEQKIPDQLLGAMLQSAKGGTPKPFSYGIDLTELKKKVGPPTAPKPRPGQPNYQGEVEEPEAPKQYGGPPRKPAGHVQTDYYIKREDDLDPTPKSKKPAGQVQSDYFPLRQTGPRSEVDESPININMGTNPKKQSKSFKVLQWMTETEEGDDSTEEPSQKPKRKNDPERRHNADDDEMRFTGLHSKSEIPSKAFGILQRLSSNDDAAVVQNGKATLDVGDAEDETSTRYKGTNIPSPSFRLLQTWAEYDPDPNITNKTDSKKEKDDDNLPDNFNNDEIVDKRYRGGIIPSKVFKVLQMSLGEDTSEASSQSNNRTVEIELPKPEVSEF